MIKDSQTDSRIGEQTLKEPKYGPNWCYERNQSNGTRNTLTPSSQHPVHFLEAATQTFHRLKLTESDMEVIEWKDNLIKVMGDTLGHNRFCTDLSKRQKTEHGIPRPPTKPVLLNMSFDCEPMFRRSVAGTGNYVGLFYGFRMVAHLLGNVHIILTCPDVEETKSKLILPWLMGYFPARPIPGLTSNDFAVHYPSDATKALQTSINGTSKFNGDEIPPTCIEHDDGWHHVAMAIQNGVRAWPTLEEACDRFSSLPVHFMIDELRYDLRRMAIALVGVPHPSHPSAAYKKDIAQRESQADAVEMQNNIFQVSMPDEPLYPHVELDDVALHFRCGDLLSTGHDKYGYIKFSSYAKLISPEARSIGILTQPFSGQNRKFDGGRNIRRCRLVVESLAKFLQEKFPKAKVSLRNDSNENIALSYARFIMANQSLAGGTSTFSIWPVMATFGTGYIRKPDGPVNAWLLNPPLEGFTNNVVLVENQTLISSNALLKLWRAANGDQKVLNWFRNE